MDKEQQILDDLARIREQMQEHKEKNRIEFFKCDINGDFYYQARILELIEADKMVVTLQGSNAIGKTVLGCVVVGAACLGIQPWDGKETRWGRRPVKVRIICSDWDKHAKMVMVPKLKEWLPQGTYTTSKNNVGVEATFTFDTGSVIEILTNKQDTQDHAGWEGDIIWADEPFSRDKFVENLRGLRVDDHGLFLITMTAVEEAWILDDIVLNKHPSYASVTEIPQRDNPTLSEKYLETFAASLTEREKIPRIEGGWLNLVGLVWPGFRKDTLQDKISHLVDPFTVPTDWPVVPLVDYHPSHPQAISFYTVDPQDRTFGIDEAWGPKWSPEMVADHIIRKKKEHTWRITDAFIDPISKGDTTYIKNRGLVIPDSYSVMKEKLWREGIELHVATKDQSSGIVNVEKMLNGVNGLPTLFFFRNLGESIEKEGILWEMRRWTYVDGKPKAENNHFCENLYRMTLTGTKYAIPRRKGEELTAETEFNVFA